MLTVVLTHHCTGACKSCCFNCSPKVNVSLKYKEVEDIINASVENFPNLQVLVLTGGEVLSLDVELVKDILCYAKSKNLSTRIVSNGFWASTEEDAFDMLEGLVEAGLDEINVSTGDAHQKFVPFENILNIARSAERIPEIKSCVIVVESGPLKKFCKDDANRALQSALGESIAKTTLIDSPWADLERKPVSFQEDEIMEIDKANMLQRCVGRGCSNLYESIQVSPYGQILSCCGFAAEYSPLLKMGDFFVNKSNLRELYARQADDLLKVWLFLDGPLGIFEYFHPGKTLRPGLHQCEICARLLSNPYYLKKIALLKKEKVQDILLRLQIKLNV